MVERQTQRPGCAVVEDGGMGQAWRDGHLVLAQLQHGKVVVAEVRRVEQPDARRVRPVGRALKVGVVQLRNDKQV